MIPLSERFNSEKADIRYSPRDDYKSLPADIDDFTEDEYNNFGWARVNNVLSKVEKRTLDSAHMAIEREFEVRHPVTKYGEHVILLGDNKDYSKLVYVKGNFDEQVITKIYEGDSFVLKEIEELEGLRLRSTIDHIEKLIRLGYIEEHRVRDFPSYTEHKRSKRQRHKQGRSEDSANNTGRKRSTGENFETINKKSNLDYNQIFYERNSFILKEIEELEGLRLRST